MRKRYQAQNDSLSNIFILLMVMSSVHLHCLHFIKNKFICGLSDWTKLCGKKCVSNDGWCVFLAQSSSFASLMTRLSTLSVMKVLKKKWRRNVKLFIYKFDIKPSKHLPLALELLFLNRFEQYFLPFVPMWASGRSF